MAICFLFTQHLNKDSCLSLRLDQNGLVDASLAQRSFAEIKVLQANVRTFIIIPTQQASLHQVELPLLADNKARTAIPFALEDRLAQNLDSLHFAWDKKNHYQQGKYLIVVTDRDYLKDLIVFFNEHDIHFDSLTLDWFALKPHEIAAMSSFLLINSDRFQGALGPDIISFYSDQGTNEESINFFPDSDILQLTSTQVDMIAHQESSYLWVAQRLQKAKLINLCQGELQQGNGRTQTKRLYQAAIGMCLLWLVSIITVNGVKIYFLNKDLTRVDNKIAVIYREFFPEAHQVISPKFRISQLLKSNQSGSDLTFWNLLDKLAKLAKTNSITIDQLRFQSQTLLVTLTTSNFATLEHFQNALERDKVKVKQTQASMVNQQVVSTLELSQ